MIPHIAVALLTLLVGCTSQYVPEAPFFPKADATIDAVVEFHPLRAAPGLVSGHETFGVLAPKVETPPPTELTDQISRALLDGLAASETFERLTAFEPQPDLILSGKIEQFYEHYRRKLWTYAPYTDTVAWLLRLNTYVSTGEVKLTATIQKATGEVIGRYSGRATFEEDFRPNADVSPGDRLNQALSESIQQIHYKLVTDPQLKKFHSQRLPEVVVR